MSAAVQVQDKRNYGAAQTCSCRCDRCGETIRAHLTHYQAVKCACGKIYWPLQPRRGGRFVLFPKLGES